MAKLQVFGGTNRPAQAIKVAAIQAWFEYQPTRVAKPGSTSLEPADRYPARRDARVRC